MKSLFGVHASSRTEITIKANALPGRQPTMAIERRGGGSRVEPGPGQWRISVEAGDYFIAVDDGVAGPVTITLSKPAVIVTTIVSGVPAPIIAPFWASALRTSDEKDPWPELVQSQGATLDPVGRAWFEHVLLPIATVQGRGSESSRIHALLIGIDDYPAGSGRTLYRSCRGGVRDALEVDAYLRSIGVPAEQITRLLAPTSGGAEPVGAADRLPTYENIAAEWRRLVDQVPSGSQVYIHYSGHGARVRTTFPDVKGVTALDEALVPCDIHDRASGRYLRDLEIAFLLERMRERGLVVTLVIDSCHSGGLSRDDATPRTGDEHDLEPRPADLLGSAVASPDELAAIGRRLAEGGGQSDSAWFFGQETSYVLLAACRQNEVAYEYAFDGVTPRGAFTYFWLEALQRLGPDLSYRAAHRAALAEIHAHFSHQTPVLVGDGDRLVLGFEHVMRPRSIPVLQATDGDVELGAGQAQLIRVGARLAVLPPASLPELVDLGAMPEVEVVSVDTTTSIARPTSATGPAIAAGSHAVLLSHGPSVTRYIKLAAPAAVRSDRPGPADDALAAARHAIAADQSNLVALAGDESANYTVAASEQDGRLIYRILDPSGRPVPHLGPDIPVGSDGAGKLVRVLQHLARFGSVATLANRSTRSPLTGRVELELLALPAGYQEGDDAEPIAMSGAPPRLAEGSSFCLRVTNRALEELHVAVLDLQPDWGISRLIPSDTSTLQIRPGETVDTILKAWLPPGLGAGRDVFKLIATAAPTDYDWLLLDPIDKPDRPTPDKQAKSPLEELMVALQRPDYPKRHARQMPSGKWTTATVELELYRR